MSAAVPAAGMVVVLAATRTEAHPLRRRLRGHEGVHVVCAGVGGAAPVPPDALLISCGLAGGLDRRLATGTVVIPDAVGSTDGSPQPCRSDLVERLRDAARRCGVEPHPGPLLTADHVVTGSERDTWAAQGYAAVDMESAAADGRRCDAAVRVVLDTRARELNAVWLTPWRALWRPGLWGEGLWLATVAPRLCDSVARVVAAAL